MYCQLLLSVCMVILHMAAIYIFILTAPSAVGLLPTLTLFSLPSRCSLHICLTHHPHHPSIHYSTELCIPYYYNNNGHDGDGYGSYKDSSTSSNQQH